MPACQMTVHICLCCQVNALTMTVVGNYRTTDEPYARGEIWLGGGNVAVGYYKNAEKTTAEFHVINGQRWFATGDIGRFEADGSLRIIGKSLFV